MNARKIIVEILDNVLLNGAYSNIEINKQFASNDIDPKDKGLITEVVYGTIKYKKMIDIILSNFVADIGKIDESVVNILRSAIYQMKFLDRVPPYAIVNEAVNLTKETEPNLAKFVNGVLRNYLRNENKNFKVGLRNNEALCYDFSFDRWMIEMFIKQYGKEDALRILRAIRFSAQLDFNIDKKTYSSIKNNYKLINNISKERIRNELEKILLCSNPIKGLNYLNETQISSLIFSSIGELIHLNRNLSLLPKDICIRISGLFRNTNPDKVKLLLKELRFSNNEINKIYLFISNYKYISSTTSKIEVKNIIANVGRNNINNLISMYEVLEEKKLDNFKKHSNYIISNKDTLYIKELNIDGSILKSKLQLNSGKIIGETLNHLLDLVINETISNDTEVLLEEAKKYIKKV
mgnify:CR=1 FL=1